ncbi:MAG: hypothetical protein WBX01_01330 [Nitrososphaeraceae archaeon]
MTSTFSSLMEDLKSNIDSNRKALENSLKVNPAVAYQKVKEITQFVGSRHSLNLQIHFPDQRRLFLIDSYGTENLGIVFDKHRKQFPIPRETIKEKALEIFAASKAEDAYMYEGKEGVRVTLAEAGRLEILPGSIHLWCNVENDGVKEYLDWLFENVHSFEKTR